METGQKRRMLIVFFGIFVLVWFFSSQSFGADPLNRCQRELDSVTRTISNKWLKAHQFCLRKLFQCNHVDYCSDNNAISSCFSKFQKTSTSIERNIKQLAVGCNRVALSIMLASTGGLGWGFNNEVCQNFGVSIEDKDDIFLCLQKIVQCKAERITTIGNPLAERIFENNNLLGSEGPFVGCIARDEKSKCGNGIREEGEECDGNLIDADCRRLGFIFMRGELQCSSMCTLDASQCEFLFSCPSCPTCQICPECPESPPCPE